MTMDLYLVPVHDNTANKERIRGKRRTEEEKQQGSNSNDKQLQQSPKQTLLQYYNVIIFKLTNS